MNEEAKIWRDRFESLKKWAEKNMKTHPAYREEWKHPWYDHIDRTESEVSTGIARTDQTPV